MTKSTDDSPRLHGTPSLAIFDFDGTLTNQDSLLPFLRMAAGSLRLVCGLAILSPILLGYFLHLLPNYWAKQVVFSFFLAGLSDKKLQELGNRFATQKISKLLRPEAVQRLQWHQAQKHQIVLVSASLEAYLLPWANTMGFEQVIGTKLESRSGILTGRIQGKNCYGEEKVRRLQALMGDLSQYCIYAYGDSRGDRELLDIADYPYYRTFHQAAWND